MIKIMYNFRGTGYEDKIKIYYSNYHINNNICIWYCWYLKPYEPMDRVKTVFNSNEDILVVNDNDLLVFKPIDIDVKTGLIFYSRAKVKPRAYAPLASEIAKTGYFVVIVPMPLNLAVFGIDRADDVINKYSNIEKWIIEGHYDVVRHDIFQYSDMIFNIKVN